MRPRSEQGCSRHRVYARYITSKWHAHRSRAAMSQDMTVAHTTRSREAAKRLARDGCKHWMVTVGTRGNVQEYHLPASYRRSRRIRANSCGNLINRITAAKRRSRDIRGTAFTHVTNKQLARTSFAGHTIQTTTFLLE